MPSSVLIAIIAGVVVLAFLGFLLIRGPTNEATDFEFGPAKIKNRPDHPKEAKPAVQDDIVVKAGRDAALDYRGGDQLKAKVDAKRDAKVGVHKA